MADYIEREAAMKNVEGYSAFRCQLGGLMDVVGFLKDQPTADVAPVVHGRWDTDAEDIQWGNSLKRKYCSACKKRPHFDRDLHKFILSDYCPHCGAKMDLKGGDAE